MLSSVKKGSGMALEKICVVRSLRLEQFFSRAIPDHFLTDLSIFLFRLAYLGHSNTKKIVGIKLIKNRVALVRNATKHQVHL